MPKKNASQNLDQLFLMAGAFAGPMYLVIGFGQALTREGFDLTRHPLSLLSNGSLGWIQITNFLLTGLLVTLGAVGMHRSLKNEKGGTWAPFLIGVYGLGLIVAGIFAPDPAFGFPPGAPESAALSFNGLMHFIGGGVGFLGLIAACLVLARRFIALKQHTWTRFSILTSVLFLAAFAGVASGSRLTWLNSAFTLAVIIAWSWLSAIFVKLLAERV